MELDRHLTGKAHTSDSLDGLSVLVVDDESDARELLADLLGLEGATVHQAEGPVAALAVLAMHTPDVLISDIAMPDVDGYWFMKRVRALGDHLKRSIPAIALTAFTQESDRLRALAAGFDRHMPKPLNPGSLIEAVRSLAGSRYIGAGSVPH